MKILTFSDIHMDHRPAWQMPTEWPEFDVAVFAGDIKGSPSDGMRWLRKVPGLEECEIVVVPGNHEYYQRAIDQENERALEAAAETRIHFLNASEVPVIGGVRFVGAPLWTDYELLGDRTAAMRAAAHMMNDHRLIAMNERDRSVIFMPSDALLRHETERTWIEGQLRTPHSGPTVVVTHHGVGMGSVHPRYAADVLTAAFASDLTEMITTHQPALWIHGHTHDGFDYMIGSTRVVCNPKGYGPRIALQPPENPLFDALKVVEIPAPELSLAGGGESITRAI